MKCLRSISSKIATLFYVCIAIMLIGYIDPKDLSVETMDHRDDENPQS